MRASPYLTLGIVFSSIIALTSSASAICTGAAPQPALQAFKESGKRWIAANGAAADVGDQVLALSAQATNTKDPDFKGPLGDMLGAASSDAGKAIGKSLRNLVNSCADPKDPGDAPDKKYISDNILPMLRSSYSANLAYGEGGGPTTASIGGSGLGSSGGGTGSGTGTTGAAAQAGGSNSGGSETGGTTDTGTGGRTAPTASGGGAGASGTTATATQTASGSEAIQ